MKKAFFFFISLSSFIYAQFGSQDSGGKLLPEQKCYDVKFYDINLTIDPAEKVIGGFTTITASALSNLQTIVIDLDNTMAISELTRISPNGNETEIPFKHENGKISLTFPGVIKPGETFSVKISYAGAPRIARRPPWDDGFIWSKSKDGKDWVTLTCQGGGADIWYPCKDHPSDEADSVATHLTVPSNLVCIGSGKLRSSVDNKNGTKTWNWFSSNPINNYSVMFYLGDYIPIEYDYTSITGEKIPFTVWVLPESLEKAKTHAPQFVQHMKINEELLGPYPFRNDKYSVVESPHLGMEHQTAIAYGAGWKNHKDFPFDWLHHHEFLHMAEKISCKKLDWFWEVYMRQASLPKLHYKKEQNKIVLWWETENNISFPLPVEVKIAGVVKRLDMQNGKGEFALTQDEEFTIDANERLLMELIKD